MATARKLGTNTLRYLNNTCTSKQPNSEYMRVRKKRSNRGVLAYYLLLLPGPCYISLLDWRGAPPDHQR